MIDELATAIAAAPTSRRCSGNWPAAASQRLSTVNALPAAVWSDGLAMLHFMRTRRCHGHLPAADEWWCRQPGRVLGGACAAVPAAGVFHCRRDGRALADPGSSLGPEFALARFVLCLLFGVGLGLLGAVVFWRGDARHDAQT